MLIYTFVGFLEQIDSYTEVVQKRLSFSNTSHVISKLKQIVWKRKKSVVEGYNQAPH